MTYNYYEQKIYARINKYTTKQIHNILRRENKFYINRITNKDTLIQPYLNSGHCHQDLVEGACFLIDTF